MENEDMENEGFEVRDIRNKGIFVIEDEFFNGYVKILGTSAFAVYCSLCRRADKNQKSYPSQKTIADELNLSRTTVNEWIRVLEYFQLIKKQRIGKQCTNRYWLLNKKHWRKDWKAILNELSSSDVKLSDITRQTIKRVMSKYLTSPDVQPLDIRCSTIEHHVSNHWTSYSKETQKKGNPIVRFSQNCDANPKIDNSNSSHGKQALPVEVKNTPAENQTEHQQICQVMDMFKKTVNPVIDFGNRGYRSSIVKLIKQFGFETTLNYVKAAISVAGKPYAPSIATPTDLLNNLGKLRMFIVKQREMTDKKSHGTGVVSNYDAFVKQFPD